MTAYIGPERILAADRVSHALDGSLIKAAGLAYLDGAAEADVIKCITLHATQDSFKHAGPMPAREAVVSAAVSLWLAEW